MLRWILGSSLKLRFLLVPVAAAPLFFLQSVTGSFAWAAVLALAGRAVLPAVGGRQMLPRLHDRELLVQWEAAPGMSQPEMDPITALATRELRAIPGVRDVGAHVGRAITSDQVVNVNSAGRGRS
jgi:Cu/Ag efflux pump CusA